MFLLLKNLLMNLLLFFLRLNHNFDVIGLCETRIRLFSSSNISLNGYKVFHTPAVTTVGGADLYLSDSLTCKPCEDLSNLICTNDENLESVFVEVVLKSRKTS